MTKSIEAVSSIVESGGVRVSVVIPAYNEARNLPYILPLIPKWIHEIILVNDHSTDDTVAVAYKLLPAIRIVNTQSGHGKGAALQTGFAAVTGDIIVMLDADGSSDPQEIPRFVEALLAGAYLVKGSRFIGEGGSADITPLGSFGNRVLISVANQLFHIHFTDIFCDLNAFWKDCLDFFEIDCEGFDVEVLIHLRACKANLEIVEVPSYEHSRIDGTSNFLTFRDGWRVLRIIIKEWMNNRSVVRTVRKYHPSQRENIVCDGLSTMEQIAVPQ